MHMGWLSIFFTANSFSKTLQFDICVFVFICIHTYIYDNSHCQMISFIVHSSQAQFTTEGKKNLSICLFLLRVLRGEPINQAWVLLRTTSPCVEPTGQRQPVLIAFNCWLLGGPQASCFWEPQVSPRHIAFFWRNNLENKVLEVPFWGGHTSG